MPYLQSMRSPNKRRKIHAAQFTLGMLGSTHVLKYNRDQAFFCYCDLAKSSMLLLVSAKSQATDGIFNCDQRTSAPMLWWPLDRPKLKIPAKMPQKRCLM
uniref:Uncharacterized protein n=1 Tax=Sphaerodactylus townsendi TaxID=933632 RepID=A0ACB8ENT8_9SAUR